MKLIVTTIVALFISGSVIADDPDFKPNETPRLSIPLTDDPVIIDGELDDESWKHAAKAENFTEFIPNEGTEPPVKTTALITYDKENIYVAFICEDDSALVRASLTERDNMWHDDFVGIFLDTYGNSTWAYYFFSNPIGIQGDELFSSISGEDTSIDLIYFSEGKITSGGYQVEMAIPFSSLRFPDKNIQNWRINFWRTHPREDRTRYSWANMSQDNSCWLCQIGYLDGIENIESASSIDILPYIVGSQSGALADQDDQNSSFNNKDIKGTMGFNIKWAATSSVTIEGALNPDFSQVESDAGQIDINSTFALYYPEKRPFFQEGSDLFNTFQNIVYTRSINNPIVSTKLIGRWENSTLAFLSAYDEDTPYIIPLEEFSLNAYPGESLSNLLRYKYNYGENNHIGMLISDRRYDAGGFDNNTSFDALYRFWDNYQLEIQYTKSFTKESNDSTLTYYADDSSFNAKFQDSRFGDTKYNPAFNGEEYNGDVSYFSIKRNARHWSFDLNFRQASPTFRAGNGFYTQNDSRFLNLWTGYTFYFEDNFLFNRIQPYFHTARFWNYDGLTKDEWIAPSLYMNLKGQTDMEIGWIINSENYSRKQFNSINRFYLHINSRFSEEITLGAFLRYGNFIDRNDLVKGHGFQALEMWSTIKPMVNFTFQPSWTYGELIRNDTDDFSFAGYIFRIRFNYQFSREASLRLISEYNNFSDRFALEPLFSYEVNPFTIFYIGMSQNQKNFKKRWINEIYNWQATSRQYFMKFQYLFSI